MIGGCSSSAQVSSNNCNIGMIYRYVQGIGYQQVLASEYLEPGEGYWILFKDVADPASLSVQGTADELLIHRRDAKDVKGWTKTTCPSDHPFHLAFCTVHFSFCTSCCTSCLLLRALRGLVNTLLVFCGIPESVAGIAGKLLSW
ncbi:MAG: hypothetical protein ACFFCW_43245 [Candidatus Hodarchaeota archaeon]